MKIDNNSSFFMKFSAGSLAGAIGSTVSFLIITVISSSSQLILLSLFNTQVGNPFDVLKTRMMAAEGAKAVGLAGAAKELYKGQGSSLIVITLR